MAGKSLIKFKPFATSPETAEYDEDTPAQDLNGPLFQLLARFQQKDASPGDPEQGEVFHYGHGKGGEMRRADFYRYKKILLIGAASGIGYREQG